MKLINIPIYIIGDVVSKITPFLLLPIVARHFGTIETGHYTNFILISTITQLIFSSWLTSYIGVSFFKSKKRFEILVRVATQALVVLFFASFLIACLTYNGQLYLRLFGVALLSGASISITNVYLTIKQLEQNAPAFVVFNVSRSITLLFSSLIFIVIWGGGNVWSVMYLNAFINILWAAVSTLKVRNYGLAKVDQNLNVRMLYRSWKFGAPLMPGVLINSMRTSADRMILIMFFGSSIAGLYAAGYQLASIVMVFYMAIIRAISPPLFKAFKEHNKALIKKLFVFYVITIFLLSTIIFIAIYYLGEFVLGQEFKHVYLFAFLSYMFFFQALSSFFTSYFQFWEKTALLMKIHLASFVVYLAVTLVGALGGIEIYSISVLFSSFINVTFMYLLGFKHVFKNS